MKVSSGSGQESPEQENADEMESDAVGEENKLNEKSTMEDVASNLKCSVLPGETSDDTDNEGPVVHKARVKRFSDSDIDSNHSDKSPVLGKKVNTQTNIQTDSEDSGTNVPKNLHKSRIRKAFSGSDSDSQSEPSNKIPLKNAEQQSRMKNKRNKMMEKFKKLAKTREKDQQSTVGDDYEMKCVSMVNKSSQSSDTSDDEASSIENLKQKIKERTLHLKSTIYDSDTSDEEKRLKSPKQMQKQKKGRKSTKETSPKPMRMSAKQAMENMQKIKSESNRMLREKEVSLPYHRPKALSLKDIMSRRKPAVSADGRALPIKMNDEQLKHYASLLEQRQKEIMELCKSDTDEEVHSDNEKREEVSLNNDSIYDDLVKIKEPETENNNCNESMTDKMSENVAIAHEKTDYVPNEEIVAHNVEIIDKTKESISNQEDSKAETNLRPNLEEGLSSIVDVNLDGYISKEYEAKTNTIEATLSTEMELVYDESIAHCNTVVENKESNVVAENILFETENSEPQNSKVCSESDSQLLSLHYDTEKINDSEEIDKVNTKIQIDSIEHSNTVVENKKSNVVAENILFETENSEPQNSKVCSESNSQLISLHYDTEKINDSEEIDKVNTKILIDSVSKDIETVTGEPSRQEEENICDNFSDDDIDMEDIDALIENAEILSKTTENIDSPMLIRDQQPLNRKPKLTGAPGMVIDLDGTDPLAPKKLTGVELLKERFTYFARLKTPEELEREREKRIKPGMQHLKLKQELEEQIAEQRSLEWAKRLDEEKQHRMEIDAVHSDASDAEDDIDKIEAKLEETHNKLKESSSEPEEEEEDISEIKEKPRKRNPMIDEEAEVSDCDEYEGGDENDESDPEEEGETRKDDGEIEGEVDDQGNGQSDEESSEESEESEDEEQSKPRKGRILKAFEDSDDEDAAAKVDEKSVDKGCSEICKDTEVTNVESIKDKCHVIKDTQDDDLQLAQMHKSFSDDLFTSQESGLILDGDKESTNKTADISSDEKDLGTQTFSILNSESINQNIALDVPIPDSLSVIGATQPSQYGDENLDHIVGMCSGSFSQNLVTSQYPTTQNTQCKDIGEDVLALCTGKFYDNQFLSQVDSDNLNNETSQQAIKDNHGNNKLNAEDFTDNNVNAKSDTVIPYDAFNSHNADINIDITENDATSNKITLTTDDSNLTKENAMDTEQKAREASLLNSLLDELNDAELDISKPNKYFDGNNDGSRNKENEPSVANSQMKKRFVIDSDDEGKDVTDNSERKQKKLKKKKLEQRALQISDDEEEDESDQEEAEDDMHEMEDDTERIVEYDSEENEVVLQPEVRKKKRKVADFFEQEAELTSEDEWAGSGDEDEAGLDRMEREAGDDETFHQGRLQRELGQIHMRDILDQDKREVRLIQELLFEDGDLGAGSRQRKFRWRNAEGEEETGTEYKEFGDTQEEEFESEEQWRKQRHEREMFLKQVQNEGEAEQSLNVSVSRNSIIKANLNSRTMSSLLFEVNSSKTEKTEEIPAPEKKSTKDIPSPKKPFIICQQNYHNSLLTRGRGALARLAALATPLAGDDDAPKGPLAVSGNRNFVFATLTPDEERPKVRKRKADTNVGTPKLVKKMKTEEKQSHPKNSLLDLIKL